MLRLLQLVLLVQSARLLRVRRRRRQAPRYQRQAPLPWRVPPRCNRKPISQNRNLPAPRLQVGPARMKRRWQVIVRLVRWQGVRFLRRPPVMSRHLRQTQPPLANRVVVGLPKHPLQVRPLPRHRWSQARQQPKVLLVPVGRHRVRAKRGAR